MAHTKKPAYLLTRNEVDFDNDEETPRRVGVYETKDEANKAKTRNVLKCLKDEGVTLNKETKQQVIAAFTGKTNGFTIDGYFVTEDEVYDIDDTHISPAYSWELETVKLVKK